MSKVEFGDVKSKYFCEREGRWRTYQELKETENDLKSENDRLTEDIRILHDEVIVRYRRERDQLKTENERLRAHNKQLLTFKVLGSPIETNADNAAAEA